MLQKEHILSLTQASGPFRGHKQAVRALCVPVRRYAGSTAGLKWQGPACFSQHPNKERLCSAQRTLYLFAYFAVVLRSLASLWMARAAEVPTLSTAMTGGGRMTEG